MGMEGAPWGFELLLLVPVVAGLVYHLLCVPAVLWFTRRRASSSVLPEAWPAVGVLKPV